MRGTAPAGPPKSLTARARSLRRGETDSEAKLWSSLRGRQLNRYKFVRQLPVGSFVADFACRQKMLIVELDGSQHASSARDDERTRWLNEQGWSVLRFWNDEVLRERDAVLETILGVLDGRISGACRGGGLFDGLRFAPGRPSPGHAACAARPPSPASGRGEVPRTSTVRARPTGATANCPGETPP